MCKFCCLVLLTKICYTQKWLPVLSLKISSLRSNVIMFDIHLKSYWLRCDWKRTFTHPSGGRSFLDCCTVLAEHNTHFRIFTAKVKVDLCNITNVGVTQICLTEFGRKLQELDSPSFSSEGMISSVTFYLL